MDRNRELWRIYFLIGVSLVIASGLIGYGYFVGDRQYSLASPMHNTLEEIEMEGAKIIHRMEGIISGTRKYDEAQLFHHLEQSILYLSSFVQAEALQAGALNESDCPDISPQIEKLESVVINWKSILERFHRQQPRYSQSDKLQAETLKTFLDFSATMAEIETALAATIESGRSRFRTVQALSIGLFVLLAAAATVAAIRYGRQKSRDFEQLEQTRKELEKELVHRREAETALASSEQLIRTIFDNSPVAIVVTRLPDSRIVNVNDYFEAVTGYARGDVVGRTFKEVPIWLNPADREPFLQQLTSKRQVRDVEIPFRMKDGRLRTFLLSANVVDLNGEAHILASARDITESKQAEARMAWLASFPMLNPYPVAEIDLDGRVHYLNPAAEAAFPGLSAQGVAHAWIADWETVTGPFRTGGTRTAVREVLFEGKWYHQALNWMEETRRIRIYGLDITQRKRAEEVLKTSHDALETWVNERTQQLRESYQRLKSEVEERVKTEQSLIKHQMQLRKLSSALVQTEERERRRISTALHDGIGQTLAATKIKLGAIRSSLPAGETVKQLDEVRDLISAAIQETRSLTFELSLPVLYEIGLKPALEWLSEQFKQKFGLEVIVEGDGCDQRLQVPERVFLFQALRELCFNVVKHARATRVTVSIRQENGSDGIRCDVIDNGIGFDAKKQFQGKDPAGFGLFSIREHLRQYGGFLTLDTGPKSGTRVALSLPLKTKNAFQGGDRYEDAGAPGG
jgi:PAS domain S-box-containing protein